MFNYIVLVNWWPRVPVVRRLRIILRFSVTHITHVTCEEYSITHEFKVILWHENTPTPGPGGDCLDWSEPRSSLWREGGEGGEQLQFACCLLPTKHAANKNKDRPFHKTLRNYYENVRLKQLHNVHCASMPMDIRILSPHHQSPRKSLGLR